MKMQKRLFYINLDKKQYITLAQIYYLKLVMEYVT